MRKYRTNKETKRNAVPRAGRRTVNVKAGRRTADADGTVAEEKTGADDEETKRLSDERRAKRGRQHIRIHAGEIENLDETEKREEAEAVEVKETGNLYMCRLLNRESRWNGVRRWVNRRLRWLTPKGRQMMKMKYTRRVELPRKLVENEVVTRCVNFFHDPKRDKMYLQFPPLKMMNRTSIQHVKKYRTWFLRKYDYYAEMDMTPEPAYVMLMCGVHPTEKEYEFALVEENGKDRYLGVQKIYRMDRIG